MNLSHVVVRPVEPSEKFKFQELMQQYHYLGAWPEIGNTIWSVVNCNNEWLSLLSFSAAALKCGARDRGLGWGYRLQYDQLHLVANNSRFLILPTCHYKNFASKVLSLCRRRIQKDWQDRFGFSLLMMETFVAPSRFLGTIYHAANWQLIGNTKGYQRIRTGYSNVRKTSKLLFIQLLQHNSRSLLSACFPTSSTICLRSTRNETYRRTNAISSRFL